MKKTDQYFGTKLSDNITETPEGYLIAHDTILARTGMQEYHASEVPVATDSGMVRIYRNVEDVTSLEALASFEGKPLTSGHPDDFVNPENWNELSMGFVKNVRALQDETDQDLHYMIADVIITNAKAIQAVKDGLRELSCGYEADYIDNGDGTGNQTAIMGNHVALVPSGRCGSACAIKDQSIKGGVMGIKDKFFAAFAKAFDEAMPEEKPMDEETVAETPAEEQKEAASIESINTKIDALIEAIKSMGMPMDEAPVVEEEAKDAEPEITADTDTISRAEILAPGIAKTGDVKKLALDHFGATDEGQKVLTALSALTGDSLFVAASEIVKLKRVEDSKPKTHDAKVIDSMACAADINAKNAAFWSKK